MAGDPLLFSRSPRLSERLAQGEVLLISIHGILEIGKARTADCPLPLANRSSSGRWKFVTLFAIGVALYRWHRTRDDEWVTLFRQPVLGCVCKLKFTGTRPWPQQ